LVEQTLSNPDYRFAPRDVFSMPEKWMHHITRLPHYTLPGITCTMMGEDFVNDKYTFKTRRNVPNRR